MKTSFDSIIRQPICYHVHNDIVKLSPIVADFGVIPKGFDYVKLNLKFKVR